MRHFLGDQFSMDGCIPLRQDWAPLSISSAIKQDPKAILQRHEVSLIHSWIWASSSLSLYGYLDADFAGCHLDRKSTSGTCQFLGSSMVSWSSRKQSNVVQSTTEAEYIATAFCCSQLLWMIATLRDFGLEFHRVPLLRYSWIFFMEGKDEAF